MPSGRGEKRICPSGSEHTIVATRVCGQTSRLKELEEGLLLPVYQSIGRTPNRQRTQLVGKQHQNLDIFSRI